MLNFNLYCIMKKIPFKKNKKINLLYFILL